MRAVTAWIAVTVGVVGVAAATLGAISYLHARRLLRPIRKPIEAQLSALLAPFVEIRFPGRHGTLAGWYLPARNGCTLLCCHGINDNAAQWVQQVTLLHRRSGFGALLFDFAGHGKSDGAMVTFGAREQDDIAAALEYLRGRGDVDMARIGLMGYSLGAISAVLFAARQSSRQSSQPNQADQPRVRALVIESGFSDLLRDIRVLFHRFTGLPGFPFAHLVVFWGERIAGVRLSEIRPARMIADASPAAVLVISDLADELADEPYDGEQLYAAAREPKQLWQVHGAGHVQAFAERPEEWVEHVGAFLDEHLAGSTSLGLTAHDQREPSINGVHTASAPGDTASRESEDRDSAVRQVALEPDRERE